MRECSYLLSKRKNILKRNLLMGLKIGIIGIRKGRLF